MALGIDVGSTGVLLVEDDDTHARLANPRPSRRIAAEVVSRMGDSVEIVHRLADGEVREELAQSLFAEAAGAAARGAGVEPPSTGGIGIAVAVPAWWTTSALDLAGRELKDRLGPRVQLVPDAVAAVMANPTVASTPREVVAVVDIGASTTSVALVADAGTPRPRLLTRGDVAIGRSGDHLAHLVMHHVLAGAQIDVRDLDGADPRTAEQARALLEQCEQATQRLSHLSAVEIDTVLGEHPIHVRLVRAELDEIGRSWSEDVVDRLGAQLQGCDAHVRRALLVGGAAHLPMFAQSISGELGLEVTVDPLPAAAFARGAARAGGSVDHRRAVPRRGMRPGPARRARGKVARVPDAEAMLDVAETRTIANGPGPTSTNAGGPPARVTAPRRAEIEAPPVDVPSTAAAPTAPAAQESPDAISSSGPTEPSQDPSAIAKAPADLDEPTSAPRASAPPWSQVRPVSSDLAAIEHRPAPVDDEVVAPVAGVDAGDPGADAESKADAEAAPLQHESPAADVDPEDESPAAEVVAEDETRATDVDPLDETRPIDVAAEDESPAAEIVAEDESPAADVDPEDGTRMIHVPAGGATSPFETAVTERSNRRARRASPGRRRRTREDAAPADDPTAMQEAPPVIEHVPPTVEPGSAEDDPTPAQASVGARAGRRRGLRRTTPDVTPTPDTDDATAAAETEDAEATETAELAELAGEAPATSQDDTATAPRPGRRRGLCRTTPDVTPIPVTDNATAAAETEDAEATETADEAPATSQDDTATAPRPGRRRGLRRTTPDVTPTPETVLEQTANPEAELEDVVTVGDPTVDAPLTEPSTADGAERQAGDDPESLHEGTGDEVPDDVTDSDENSGSGRSRRRRAGVVLLIVVVLVAAIAAWAYGAVGEPADGAPAAPSSTTPTPSLTPTLTPTPAADPTSVTPTPSRIDGSPERNPSPRSTGSTPSRSNPTSAPAPDPATDAPSSPPPVEDPPATSDPGTPPSDPATPSAETTAP